MILKYYNMKLQQYHILRSKSHSHKSDQQF